MLNEKLESNAASLPEGHEVPLDELLKVLRTSPETGLSTSEAQRRLQVHGPNAIPKVKRNWFRVYIAPLLEWLITMYIIMTIVLLILAIWNREVLSQAIQWSVFVIANFAIAIVQQYRAQKKIDALHRLAAPSSTVIRDGAVDKIEAVNLVPGDIIELRQGDRIPADARIIESSNFMVNEASLTGESVPITKVESGTVVLDEDVPIAERKNMVFSGTYVQFGSARAVVVRTGPHTEIGRISRELAELNTGDIPLRRKVNQLGKYLTLLMFLFLITSVYYQIQTLQGQGLLGDVSQLAQRLSVSIITSMAVMPINIPLLTTIVLLTGVLAMASHRVIIRNLAAVESLGRISVLCSDKTGTITRGQMTVKRIWDGKYLYGVTGLGYGPSGVIFPVPDEIDVNIPEDLAPSETIGIAPGSSLELILINGFLNNTAELIVEELHEPGTTSWKATGSATDAALLALFKKSGMNEKKIRSAYKKIREYPFDSSLKRMSTLFSTSEGYIVFTKGATEVILPRCTQFGPPNKIESLTEEKRTEILERVNAFAGLGFRVLSFAYKRLEQPPERTDDERDSVENGLTYLGFVCLLDPPREGAKDAVMECLSAGVTPIMITGDSLLTAKSIAKQIGMFDESQGHEAHYGKEASELSEDEFERTRVFARVAPKDKQTIVERYQKKNRVVGMTGDGVNDALALSMADAGIVMGITGTDVAKEAGDIIIADDSFVSIVTGIKEGRSLFQKIRIMIFFYICVNLAEAMLYMGSTFILSPLGLVLLDNWQRAYIFGIAHAIPPLALIFDKTMSDIMERKPIDTAGIFNWKMLGALFVTAIPLALVFYTIYYTTFNPFIGSNGEPMFAFLAPDAFNKSGFIPVFRDESGGSFLRPINWAHAKARTMLLTSVYIIEPLIVLSLRRIDKPIWKNFTDKDDRYWLAYLMVFSIQVMHLFFMYVPMSQDIIRDVSFGVLVADIIPLNPVDWAYVVVLSLIPLVILESYKFVIRKKGEYF